MDRVLEQRKEIEERIADLTFCTRLERTVAERGDEPAYSDKIGVPEGDQGWRTLTWSEVRRQALELAAGLAQVGLAPGDTMAIMASNRTEHVLADIAAVHAGGTPMTIYATLAPEQVAYVAGNSEPTVVVLEGADQLRRWEKALAEVRSIKAVVVIDPALAEEDPRAVAWDDLLAHGREARAADPAAYDHLWRSVRPDDALTILYTSGTTGNPKGVVLTHHSILFEAESSLETSRMFEPGIGVSYLPFAHIAERMLTIYIPQYQGAHMHLIGDPALLVGALGAVHPTRFFGVPRVWEKIRTGVSGLLAAETDEAKKAAIESAMSVGLRYVESRQTGQQTSPELAEQYAAADSAVLSPIRGLLGLDRVEWAASAAAPMPVEVTRFFAGLGLEIYDVYGMTETSAVVTANGPDGFRLGSVGRPIAGVEVRLGEDNEILVRGPVNTPGYFKQEEATKALVDQEGWLHTGDIGQLDEDGFFYVVDRKKEMIITSAGKNIAPSNIENLLKESPLVGHALVFGDDRPYCVAVLTLDGEIAPLVAKKHGIEFTDLADLARNPQILALVQQAVDSANERLSRPEQVKRFELLPTEWTAESEELTPTLKLKRRVVHAKYQDVLERLYA
ncbi:MAG TPA: long-chain fatty acid--CoA ligase [Nocardioidaceae bacterium]